MRAIQAEWKEWGEAHPEGSVTVAGRRITRDFGYGQPFPVPEETGLLDRAVLVLAPRGAVVLWDGRLPHQNFPNTGTDFRMVHYFSWSAADREAMAEREEALRRKSQVYSVLGREAGFGGLTDLGRRVLCVPEDVSADDLAEELKQAIRLTHEAEELELEGRLDASVEMLYKAGKVFPDIEQRHGAIFGT